MILTKQTFKKMMLTVCAVVLTLTLNSLVSAQIAAWDFTGEASPATSPADTFNANLDSSSLVTRGTTAASSVGSNSFRTVGFQNNGISTANTDYFQTTLSASTGFVLSLSSIDARYAGTATYANAPGVTSQYAYSLDGVNFTLIGAPSQVAGTPQTSPTIDLTGITALQNVPADTTVTFRYYATGQTTTGGWGFFSPAAGQNGLAFGGTVTMAATAADADLSGRVSNGRGRGLEFVSVTISGGSLPQPITTTTSNSGRYSFSGIPTGDTYLITVESKRYTFSQPTVVYSVNGSLTNIDFVSN